MARHQHHWDIVGSTYTPPSGVPLENFKVHGEVAVRMIEMAEKSLYGFTVFSLRCSECGEPSTRTFVGKWEDQGSKIERAVES